LTTLSPQLAEDNVISITNMHSLPDADTHQFGQNDSGLLDDDILDDLLVTISLCLLLQLGRKHTTIKLLNF